MKKIITVFCCVLVLMRTDAFCQSKDTIRVLFVGNSYTYFWNMPQLVAAMAATQNKVIITRKSTVGGAYLREHWRGERGLKTQEKIKDEKWDYIVIQNNSLSTIQNRDTFMFYGKKFIDLARKSGAQPLLYTTWAREYNPLMQKAVTKGYEDLAAETHTKLIPVGPVWERARSLRPDLELFDPDGSHPSPIGTYLIASVFYHAITGAPTESIPERIKTVDKDGEELYLSIMSKQNAGFIHQLVDEFDMSN